MTSLDPTMTIGKQVMEAMRFHYKMSKKDAEKEPWNCLNWLELLMPQNE